MHLDSKCLICGTVFERQRLGQPRVYCSAKCNAAARKLRHPRIPLPATNCIVCLTAFVPRSGRQRFCSAACKNCYNNHRLRHTLKCEGCGTPFKAKTRNQRFCSLHCSLTYTVIKRTLTCIACGKTFRFTGRCKAKRCEPCRKKWQVVRTTKSKIKRQPEMRVGAGSGGAQWGTANHRWNEYSPYHGYERRKGYIAGFNRICYKHWPKRCAACGSTRVQAILDVHHINGNRKDSRPCNLIPLCRKCHMPKIHNKKYKTEREYVDATFAILPKKCRNKIAELSGKAETLIRTEGYDLTPYIQGQSIGTEETIMSPRGRDTLLAG